MTFEMIFTGETAAAAAVAGVAAVGAAVGAAADAVMSIRNIIHSWPSLAMVGRRIPWLEAPP